MSTPLLSLKKAVKHYPTQAGTVHALDGVDLEVGRGETLGLVGESGCGKSTVARVALRLTPLTAGRIDFDGEDVTKREGKALQSVRSRLQMVFQDPYASLNPRVNVGRALEEPLVVQQRGTAVERREHVAWALARVGLRPEMATRYPHEFSGGQRQRIGIARALMLRPALIVCDEAVSALDVSVRAQVLNLLLGLREEFGVSYLFISHDLSVVRHISDRIAVMYAGLVVEQGPSDAVWRAPLHPYTRALMSAIPRTQPGAAHRARTVLQGDLPDPLQPPVGCRFHPRCPQAVDRCRQEAPALRPVAAQWVACHFA
ncbi:ABC transporter ATP-binding protein [Variovorax arabinosiphilus]|uniref:ABC transporter ATP-binding protein n=1 Tax=Variovorax arabinosiphilus TaxID=3053498 RepID=UPI0025776EB8|nr:MULTISPECIES: dipeptide ABC transporter ATP-binding protein [unclassified Variovorax]MDM0119090.1 dipeptide ABC transporter ATP-binding protein [Variovorax sp. J2L1-78]MDM0129516.1 dipeptide ABC transporter ATP-binding protein [Variovorax sp. J2L1-63]MDM0232698.1 dipeptide ABC transporter ATP-binding protein [Variovorax sp. J2R1-6]